MKVDKRVVDNDGFVSPNKKKHKRMREQKRQAERDRKMSGADPPDFVTFVNKMEKKHRRSMDVWEHLRIFSELKLTEDDIEPHTSSVYCFKHYPACSTLRRARRRIFMNEDSYITDWFNYIEHDGEKPNYQWASPQSDEKDFSEVLIDKLEKLRDVASGFKDLKVTNDAYVSVIEDIITVATLAFDSTARWHHIVMVLISIIKSKTGTSFTSLVDKHIMNFMINKDVVEPQSFISSGNIRNFSSMLHSKFFKQFHRLLVVLVTYGFVQPMNISIKNLELFSVKSEAIHTNASDLIDYILETITYFFDAGYRLFTGDYTVFTDIDELNRIDRDIIFLKTNIKAVSSGKLFLNTGKTIGEFQQLLMSTHLEVEYMSRTVKDRYIKLNVMAKLEVLSSLIIQFKSFNYMGGLRKAPFSVSFYGSSQVGKSSVANVIINSVCRSNGIDIEDEQICTLQPDDKFYSTYKHNTLAVIIDDVNNTKGCKAVVNPAAMFISLVNNIKYAAPKADTPDKGTFQVEPHIVVSTTNTKLLGAGEWSNEPISVLRRLRYHVEVTVKPEYSKNQGKLDGTKITQDDLEFAMKYGYDNFWLFTVEEVVSNGKFLAKGQCEGFNFHVVSDDLGRLENVDITRLVRFMNIESAKHYSQQENFVESAKNIGKRMSFCKICKNFANCCTCLPLPADAKTKDLDPEPQSFIAGAMSDYVVDNMSKVIYNRSIKFYQDLMPTPVETYLSKMSGYSLANYCVSKYCSLLRFIPLGIRETEWYRTFHFYRNRKRVINTTGIMGFMIASLMAAWSYYLSNSKTQASYVGIGTLFLSSVLSWRVLYAQTMDELRTVPYCSIIDPQTAESVIRNTLRVGITITAGLTLVKIIKSVYAMAVSTPHGNLVPTCEEDLKTRDAEKCHWSKTSIKHVGLSKTENMTAEQLANKIKGNCLHLSYTSGGKERATSVVALRSNVFMCPYHFFFENCNISSTRITGSEHNGVFTKGVIYLKITRFNTSFFNYNLDLEDIVRVGKLDLCIFSITSGGSFLNILPFVSNTHSYEGPVRLVHRDETGSDKVMSGDAKIGKYSYRTGLFTYSYDGNQYVLSSPTSRGMCSAPVISECKGPSIIGFHIAGHTGKNTGYSLFASRTLLETTIKDHFLLTGRIEPHSASDFSTVRYGKSMQFDERISNEAPVCWREKEPYIIRGSIGTQTTFPTNIRPSILCKTFHEITGTTLIWGPPKMRPSWKPWSDYLGHACQPVTNLPTNLLKRASLDYAKPLLKIIGQSPNFIPNRPLTTNEIVNGIHGIRFVDSMNMGSGFGYPVSGTKRSHIDGEPGNMYFTNQDEIDLEITKMEDCYRKGERAYPVFRACLKDEATKITKDKVRVFHAADMALQFMLRKLFLPVLRVVNMHPLTSECAVGLNCHSNEWDQMHRFVTFDGTVEDRILAGDYSKWDIRLPPDLVLTAFGILIDMARAMGTYTDEELCFMHGLATDVTYFNCHFNGTLIEFVSGVPSGHNLTAVLNSICNSLLIRCGFFHLGNKGTFRESCHCMTYGDDFFSGVRTSVKNFNHLLYRDFLATYGMTLTMPIKDAQAVAFINIWECDFLKRRSVVCPYDGIIYGALDMESINKSLVIKGKTAISPRAHAYDVLTGAVRELSYHPKSVYDEWIEIYRKVAIENDFVIADLTLDHYGYFQKRNQILDSTSDTIYGFTPSTSVDYPTILEASDEDVDSAPNEISSLEESDSSEFGYLNDYNGLTNNYNINSYLSTKVKEGCVDPLQHTDSEPQSNVFGNVPSTQDAAHMESGITHLSGAKEEKVISTNQESSELLSLRQNDSRSLANYLSRPALIASIPLNSFPSTYAVQILAAFLNQKRIREKIRYYAYLNGVLNVKVTTVGSPQSRGAYLIGLHPWWARDNGLGPLGLSNERIPSRCQMSQLPSFIVDIGMETGGHIKMPIIAPTNGLNISEFEQINESFRLYVEELVQTEVPAGSSMNPSIQIHAWIDDAQLTGTTTKSELPDPQTDEFVKDPNTVGDSASMDFKTGLAKAAGKITGMATERGVEMAMSALGFSQPLRPEGVTPIIPRAITNMACYNSEQNIDSLAADIKNQVSIGTEELGYSDIDHMSLSSINQRWSYLGQFSKDCDNILGSVSDTTVIQVSPLICPAFMAGADTVFSPTAVAASTLPFSKWRGGLEFKFTAVGSAFLKGKIKIAHDVNSNIDLSAANYLPLDTQALNNVIWDVSQYRSIVVQVPWSSNLAFKDTGQLREWIAEGLNASTGYDLTSNGVLLIDKFTRLSDLEYPDCSIMVHVRAMEGFAYGDVRAVLAAYTFSGINYGQLAPTVPEPQSEIRDVLPPGLFYGEDGQINFGYATPENVQFYNDLLRAAYALGESEPQSDIKTARADVTTFGGQESDTIMVVNINGMENNVDDHGKMMELCMGEKFFHLRQILKRYTENFTRNYFLGNGTGQVLRRLVIPDRPLVKGWQGFSSVNFTPTPKPATYARDSFLSYFSMCFLGYRGSFRHKVTITSNDGNSRSLMTYVARATPGYVDAVVPHNASYTNLPGVASSASASSILTSPDVRAGGTLAFTNINPVVEYATPFQCRAKFAWAQDRTPQTVKFSYDGGYDIPWHQIAFTTGEVTNKWVRLNKYIAAGDDFSLFFYLYPPTMLNRSPGIHSQV